MMNPRTQSRGVAIIEVLCLFALVHVTYRAVMHFTAIGALDRRAGTNLVPGVVMILFTVGVLLIGRRNFTSSGLSLAGIPAGLFFALLGALLGLPLMVAWGYHHPLLQTLLTAAALVIGAGVGEELFFRGYIQSRINEAFGRPFRVRGVSFGAGLIVSTVLFAFLHTLNPVDYFHGRYPFAWGLGAVTLGSGLLFAWLREATGSVAAGIIAHSLIDILASVPKMIS